MRARRPALRRREGRRDRRPAQVLDWRARAHHPPLHQRDGSLHRAANRCDGARHGHERADDGVDDGHLFAPGRPRRARASSPASRSASAARSGARKRPVAASRSSPIAPPTSSSCPTTAASSSRASATWAAMPRPAWPSSAATDRRHQRCPAARSKIPRASILPRCRSTCPAYASGLRLPRRRRVSPTAATCSCQPVRGAYPRRARPRHHRRERGQTPVPHALGSREPTARPRSRADAILRQRLEIFVIPDILCNSGGVIVSYFEWVQDLQSFFWAETEIFDKLYRILGHTLDKVLKEAKQARQRRPSARRRSPSAFRKWWTARQCVDFFLERLGLLAGSPILRIMMHRPSLPLVARVSFAALTWSSVRTGKAAQCPLARDDRSVDRPRRRLPQTPGRPIDQTKRFRFR